jgi:hypothetical protein
MTAPLHGQAAGRSPTGRGGPSFGTDEADVLAGDLYGGDGAVGGHFHHPMWTIGVPAGGKEPANVGDEETRLFPAMLDERERRLR